MPQETMGIKEREHKKLELFFLVSSIYCWFCSIVCQFNHSNDSETSHNLHGDNNDDSGCKSDVGKEK